MKVLIIRLSKNKILAVAVLVVIAGIIYFNLQNAKGNENVNRYALGTVEKGTLVVSVSGSGQVDVSSTVDIKPKASGQITKLNVKNGDNVKAGSVIAQIDTKDAQKAVRNASLALESAQLSLQKLKEPADKYEILSAQNSLEQAKIDLKKLQDPPTALELLTAENAVTEAERQLQQAKDSLSKTNLSSTQELDNAYDDGFTAVSNAYLELPQLLKDTYKVQWDDDNTYSKDNITSYQILLSEESPFITSVTNDYQKALHLFNTNFELFKTIDRDSDKDSLYDLIDQTLQTTKALSQSLESDRNLLDAIYNKNNYDDYYIGKYIEPYRTMVMTDISTINKHVTTLQNAKDALDNAITNSPIDVTTAQNNITAAEENLKQKQASLQDLKDGATAEDIALAQKKVEQQQQNLDKLLEGSDALDIKAQELNIREKQNSLLDAQQTLEDYTIIAPFDCIVSATNVSKGDTVSSGTSIATVITNQMIAKVSLNETDVATVKVGQKATLTFDAIENLTITGEVVEIDAVGTASQGVVTYNVKISFDTQDTRIKPGMSTTASIITNSKSDILIVPNGAIKTQGDISYVESFQTTSANSSADTSGNTKSSTVNSSSEQVITSSNPPSQIQIETGLANDSYTEITSGLNEGDQIVTRTITSAKTTTTTSTKSAFSMGMGGGPGR